MIKPLEELTDDQLMALVQHQNLNTLALLNALEQARTCNEVLQKELKRRMDRNAALPQTVARELERIGRAGE